MRTISDLLLNYKIPGVQDAEKRKVCAEEISKLTGYQLSSKQLTYKEGKLTLVVPSVLKSAILLRQDELMKNLSDKGIALSSIL